MAKQIWKLTMYDVDDTPVTLRVYRKDEGAPYEMRVDNEFWATCETPAEVNCEIREYLSLYRFNYFPQS